MTLQTNCGLTLVRRGRPGSPRTLCICNRVQGELAFPRNYRTFLVIDPEVEDVFSMKSSQIYKSEALSPSPLSSSLSPSIPPSLRVFLLTCRSIDKYFLGIYMPGTVLGFRDTVQNSIPVIIVWKVVVETVASFFFNFYISGSDKYYDKYIEE